MKVESKYNVGDEVWIIHNGKPAKYKVNEINIVIRQAPITILYHLIATKRAYTMSFEEFLFPTKDELLKSL